MRLDGEILDCLVDTIQPLPVVFKDLLLSRGFPELIFSDFLSEIRLMMEREWVNCYRAHEGTYHKLSSEDVTRLNSAYERFFRDVDLAKLDHDELEHYLEITSKGTEIWNHIFRAKYDHTSDWELDEDYIHHTVIIRAASQEALNNALESWKQFNPKKRITSPALQTRRLSSYHSKKSSKQMPGYELTFAFATD